MTDPSKKTVLFCRSGGGPAGLEEHAGMWLALQTAGITSTHCAGNSAGAIVSAFDAAGHDAVFFTDIMRGMRGDGVLDWKTAAWLRAGIVDHLIDTDKISALLNDNLPQSWLDLQKHLHVFATELPGGDAVSFEGDSDVPVPLATLASMSISGIFPHVMIADAPYVDGGYGNNAGLPADWGMYDEVWMLIAGGPHRVSLDGDCAVARLLHSMSLFMRAQLSSTLTELGLSLDRVLADGYDCAARCTNGRTTTIRALWADIQEPGGWLTFNPGIIGDTYMETMRLLTANGLASPGLPTPPLIAPPDSDQPVPA